MPRIVSLLPSATEIVCALGFRAALVGRSHECDYPHGVEELPVCTEPRVNPVAPGTEIHREVMALLKDAVSLYELHIDTLESLAPDIIVTQTQCEVCAVSLVQVEHAVRERLGTRSGQSQMAPEPAPQPIAACDPAWVTQAQRRTSPESARAGVAPRLVSLEPTSLRTVWDDIGRVAHALEVPDRGAALVKELKCRMWTVSSRAAGLRPKPRVAILEWLDPPMGAGNWMPELVTLAGGENLFGTAGQHSPWLEWEQLLKADPDVILVAPCGFSLEKTREEARRLTARTGWQGLKAVQEGRVALTDGHQYFNRPGPRLVESLEILAEILHPRHFDPVHKAAGWEPMAH